ncbi:MAG: DUF4339 domain-containing protein [Planctomycetaceae bacterium]|jgi:hypothetical protein|nr:DUF4339 domain-containing protein [Planctomycetaceae bacterium]
MAPQQWYYRKGTARFGPVSSADIKKMATEGKLEPTDLLRGVGMTEWVVASRVKGLFPKTASELPAQPESNNELGLAPLEPVKQEVAPAVKPVANVPTAKPVPPKPAVKPVANIPTAKPVPPKPAVKPQTPIIPAASQPFVAPNIDTSNPFAQFGLDQTIPNAPLPNDPFAIGNAGFGNFDNLVALEKQGQAIYREPAVTVEPDPFAAEQTKSKTATSAISDFGLGGYILFLGLPFLFVLLICFPIGVITAWVPLRIIAIAIAVGTSKMVGLISGSCMLKVKIKNEVLALGYGGLVGLFVTYIFIGASFWTYINVSAYLWKIPQQNQSFTPPEMDEDGRSLVLRPDEPTPFSDTEQQLSQQPIPQETTNIDNKETENGEENNNESANIDTENTEKNDSASKIKQEEDEESENEEAPEWAQNENNENNAEMKRLQDRMDLMERLFGKGISLLESIFPWILLRFVWIEIEFNPIGYLFYWFLMCGILVAVTAHSTWMSNLGSDPTSNSGF